MSKEDEEIEKIVSMIDGKMDSGVSRLLVSFSGQQESGTKKEWYHHGRCDVRSPWANGTAPNCDAIDSVD